MTQRTRPYIVLHRPRHHLLEILRGPRTALLHGNVTGYEWYVPLRKCQCANPSAAWRTEFRTQLVFRRERFAVHRIPTRDVDNSVTVSMSAGRGLPEGLYRRCGWDKASSGAGTGRSRPINIFFWLLLASIVIFPQTSPYFLFMFWLWFTRRARSASRPQSAGTVSPRKHTPPRAGT